MYVNYSQSSFAVGFIGQQHLTHMNKHGQHADRSAVTDVTCKVVIDPFCERTEGSRNSGETDQPVELAEYLSV